MIKEELIQLNEKFENEISSTFPQGAMDFDPKKVKNSFFPQSHNPAKLSLECLV